MASPLIRARIAPIALLIALAFVVIGFLRADHEMTRAERDRAALVVSETATLVEVFLQRHLAQLHSIERVIDEQLVNGTSVDTISVVPRPSARLPGQFEHVWIVDSVLNVRGLATAHSERDTVQLTAKVTNQLRGHTARDPVVIPDVQNGARKLLFIQPLGRPNTFMLIGVTRADSLVRLLQRQRPVGEFRILITVASDTVAALSTALPNRSLPTLSQPIVTPFTNDWTVTMTYAPSGRGVRIALWVVGLGAIIGLGIGLLLERREASRIADRSSELEHLSAELLRANRAKSEFLANVSHELRTPLNAIVGFVDLLRDGVYGPLNARQSGPVERIEASANHLRHLVDQVLDLAKMAAGRLEVHTEPIELRPFVFDVASEVEPLMTERGLSFSLAVGASLPRVRTDPTHLRQILINLLGNAVKFTSNGGISVRGKVVKRNEHVDELNLRENVRTITAELLSISPKPDSVWIALQVADSGIGIPEKDRERIFDEFEQVNAGPRGDSMRRGTGLGLSISRRLARLLGGDITVESELGRGSVFTVWLPVDSVDLQGDQIAGHTS